MRNGRAVLDDHINMEKEALNAKRRMKRERAGENCKRGEPKKLFYKAITKKPEMAVTQNKGKVMERSPADKSILSVE